MDEKDLVDRINDILIRHDPIQIFFGDNFDEYGSEARAVAEALPDCRKFEDLALAVWKVFHASFTARLAGGLERYRPIADEIWALSGLEE